MKWRLEKLDDAANMSCMLAWIWVAPLSDFESTTEAIELIHMQLDNRGSIALWVDTYATWQ